jgi:hypothetical protein
MKKARAVVLHFSICHFEFSDPPRAPDRASTSMDEGDRGDHPSMVEERDPSLILAAG